jgi:DNA-binding GntR family transcriptional regulator
MAGARRKKERVEELTATIAPVGKETMNDRVYRELKNLIMTGAFAPGAELILREVAQVMGTSLMPVRDGMRRLVSEHGLDALPSGRMVIPVLNAERFEEIRRIRLMLESEAVALAASRISKKQLTAVKVIFRNLVSLEPDNRMEFWNLNQKLHFAIYEAAGSPLLLAMIESLWLQLGPLLTRIPVSRALKNSADPHQLLLTALEKGGPEAARAALVADISDSSVQVMAVLEGQAKA